MVIVVAYKGEMPTAHGHRRLKILSKAIIGPSGWKSEEPVINLYMLAPDLTTHPFRRIIVGS